MAQIKVVRRWAPGRLNSPAAPAPPALPAVRAPSRRPEIVAIGASTGGPQALQQILTHLSAAFPVPILVVQHIAAGFAGGMVEWLRPQCALPIRLAANGERLDQAGDLRGAHGAST